MEFICKRRIIFEYSALIIGILLALMLPVNTPWWISVLGAIIAVGVGKYLYGGFGQNIFNPAVLSRVLLMALFPAIFILPKWTVDGVSGATVLSKEIGATMPSLSTLLLNPSQGSLAQAMPIAVLLGGAILLIYKLIDWRVPLFYLATISLLSILLPGSEKILGHAPHLLGNPLLQIVAGGSLLTSFFLLTDPVSSPYSSNGRIVFSIFAGVFTMIIRYYTPYPDGAVFGVLAANAMVPTIDKFMLRSSVSNF
jgi:electron transport complex protein RnfD